MRRFLTLVLCLLLLGAPVAPVAASTTWNLIVDDTFATNGTDRTAFPIPTSTNLSAETPPDDAFGGTPNTFNSPSVGGQWIDHTGKVFQINSSGVFGYGTNSAVGLTSPWTNLAYRPAAETGAYSKIIGHFPVATTIPNLGLCYTVGTGANGSGYIFEYSSGNAYILRNNAGTVTNLVFQKPVPLVPTTATYKIEFSCETTGGGDTLTAQLYLESDTGDIAPFWTGTEAMTYTDTSGSKLTTGVPFFPISGSTTARVNRLQTYLGATSGTLTTGTPSIGAIGKTTLQVLYPGTTGGTSPYTLDLYRSTANGTKGTKIATATSFPYADSALTANTTYYYTVEATDSAGTPAVTDTTQIHGLTSAHILLCVGDSNMGNFGNTADVATSMPSQLCARLNSLGYNFSFINQAVTGSASGDWISGSANMNAAITAGAGMGAGDYLLVTLGTNDAKTAAAVSDVTFKSNTTSGVNAFLAAHSGVEAVLNCPFWVSPAATGWDVNAVARVQGYDSDYLALVNSTTIFVADTRMFDIVRAQMQKYLNTDYIHLNTAGQTSWANNIAAEWPFWPDGTSRVQGSTARQRQRGGRT